MLLTSYEQEMLEGKNGIAAQKAMQILVALGKIYGAEDMVPVSSVQIAGVSYDNLGEAGLEFLSEMANHGGKTKVLATLNPAGMDLENWHNMGISPEFANQQIRVIQAFEKMGIQTSCTCTPYLAGNCPNFGNHIAWSESSAVTYANSVLGARTNREGGPSALAAALTGVTPRYGYHLLENRIPDLKVIMDCSISGSMEFGALGKVIGNIIDTFSTDRVVYIQGIFTASLEELKSFSASIATFGGAAMFHMENITPEFHTVPVPATEVVIKKTIVDQAIQSLNNAQDSEIDFVSLGCPHLSISEISILAKKLDGKKVRKTMWITTSRANKRISDQLGFTSIIEKAGAIFAVDTCCVVAPIKGRFTGLVTDSAKACYYAAGKNRFKTRILRFEDAIDEALK